MFYCWIGGWTQILATVSGKIIKHIRILVGDRVADEMIIWFDTWTSHTANNRVETWRVRPSVKPIANTNKLFRNSRVMVICPTSKNTNSVRDNIERRIMARIAGVIDKRGHFHLPVYGIGLATSKKRKRKSICRRSEDIHVGLTLEDYPIAKWMQSSWRWPSSLFYNIKRLMEIGSYRGIRHRRGLPVKTLKTMPTRKR